MCFSSGFQCGLLFGTKPTCFSLEVLDSFHLGWSEVSGYCDVDECVPVSICISIWVYIFVETQEDLSMWSCVCLSYWLFAFSSLSSLPFLSSDFMDFLFVRSWNTAWTTMFSSTFCLFVFLSWRLSQLYLESLLNFCLSIILSICRHSGLVSDFSYSTSL